MKIDLEEIQKRIDQKLISREKHPSAELYIYNYTQVCQFQGAWDKYTMMCRGLITDMEGNIVARPFPKFFNLEENKTDLPAEDFEIYEKYDGSLGILYWVNNEPYIATRGSFISDQAIKGTELFREVIKDYDKFDKDYTFLFEIIYPENRIVCNYGDCKKLVLLAIIETSTGREIDVGDRIIGLNEFEVAKRYDALKDLTKLKELEEPNKEGFVIKFKSGVRVKVKFDEYVRLHKLITGLSIKSIWEIMKNGKTLDDLLNNVPDEFFKWARDTWDQIERLYKDIENETIGYYAKIKHLTDRKSFAIEATKTKYPSILFSMYDDRDYSEIIYKIIKPKGNLTFKIDE